MAVNVEMWQREVKNQLFKANEFLATMKNADEYVVGGDTVHIPQSGGASAVQKNRTTVPATAQKRGDTIVTYPLHEYTTDPRLITNIDKVELSYDKMSSIIQEDTEGVLEEAGENVLVDIATTAPIGNKIATTGAASAATVDGSTGNRKIITAADIRAARKMLNNMKAPKKNRYMILSEEMIDQLMSDDTLTYAFQQTVNISEGTLPRLFGFQLMSRETVLRVDNSQVVKAVGAAGATTDADAALFYHKNFVERALGDIKAFEDADNPLYYGDIISFLIRCGSRANREDNKGYGFIYRDAA